MKRKKRRKKGKRGWREEGGGGGDEGGGRGREREGGEGEEGREKGGGGGRRKREGKRWEVYREKSEEKGLRSSVLNQNGGGKPTGQTWPPAPSNTNHSFETCYLKVNILHNLLLLFFGGYVAFMFVSAVVYISPN